MAAASNRGPAPPNRGLGFLIVFQGVNYILILICTMLGKISPPGLVLALIGSRSRGRALTNQIVV